MQILGQITRGDYKNAITQRRGTKFEAATPTLKKELKQVLNTGGGVEETGELQ